MNGSTNKIELSRKKMIRTVCVSICVTFFLLGALMFYTLYNGNLQTLDKQLNIMTEQTSRTVDQSIAIIDNCLIGLTAGKELSNWETYYSKGISSPDFIQYRYRLTTEAQLFLTYNSAWQFNLFTYASIFIDDSLVSLLYKKQIPLSKIKKSLEETYQTRVKDNSDFTQIIPPREVDSTIYFTRRIKNDFSKHPSLTLMIGVDESIFYEQYKSLLTFSNRYKAYGFILDKQKRIISSNSQTLLGHDFYKSILSEKNIKPDNLSKIIYKNQKYLFFFKTMEAEQMTLCYMIPEKELIYQSLQNLNTYYLIGLLIGIIMIGSLVYLFIKNSNFIKDLIKERYQGQLILKDLQIKSLQHQMNPHFLFNILLTIQIRAKKSKDDIMVKMIQALSTLLRSSLYGEELTFIPIKEELKLVEFYLYLQEQRFQERLNYKIELSEELRDIKIPKLTIEPLVENAVIHGVETSLDLVLIEVKIAQIDTKRISITITDNGCGFNTDNIYRIDDQGNIIFKKSQSLGLQSTYKRLKLIYGDSFQFNIESSKTSGTKINLQFNKDE